MFYEDKEKHAFQLQTEVMQSFHDRETKCIQKSLYIFERSLKSSLDIFASLNCKEHELEKLTAIYDKMGRDKIFPNTSCYYICLTTSPEKCLEHVWKRQKSTDGYITLEYLKMLDKKHYDVFVCPKNPKIFVVDGNTTEDVLTERVSEIIREIISNTPHQMN